MDAYDTIKVNRIMMGSREPFVILVLAFSFLHGILVVIVSLSRHSGKFLTILVNIFSVFSPFLYCLSHNAFAKVPCSFASGVSFSCQFVYSLPFSGRGLGSCVLVE
jgi:hypothetical protein